MKRAIVAAGLASAVVLGSCTPAPIGNSTKVTTGASNAMAVSADGTYVVYDAVLADDRHKLVLKDLGSGAKVDLTAPSEEWGHAFISSDGRYTTFATRADPSTGTYTDLSRVYRYDRVTKARTLLDTSGVGSLPFEHLSTVSTNGRYVGLVRPNGIQVLDAATAARTTVVGFANDDQQVCGVANDGKSVLYVHNGVMRLRDVPSATVVKTWTRTSGIRPWGRCSLSGDGKVVYFAANSSSLPGGPAPDYETYLYSWGRVAQKTTLVSRVDTLGMDLIPVSDDGRYAFIESRPTTSLEAVALRYDRTTGVASPLAGASGVWLARLRAGSAGTVAIWENGIPANVYRWRAG